MYLANRYRLEDTLATGGMGRVWRGYDELLSRPVAVKEVRVPPDLAERDRAILHERTMREARAAARVDHPAVTRVYDIVEADGRPWIVMQLVQAANLHETVRGQGPLPPRRVAEIGMQVADALAAAHAAGVVHRDVKPRNVLLTEDGRAVLTDFGIATSSGDPSITDEGVLVGSPAYMAPEQARGERPGPPADLWSLGATLYLAVEGHPPFDDGSPVATLMSVMLREPPEPRYAGPLGPVLRSLLVKDPAARPSVAELRRALADAAAADTTDATTDATADGAADTRRPARPAPTTPDTGAGTRDLAGEDAVVSIASLLATASQVGADLAKEAARRAAGSANDRLARSAAGRGLGGRGGPPDRADRADRPRRRLRFKKRWVAVPLGVVAGTVLLLAAAVAAVAWGVFHLLS